HDWVLSNTTVQSAGNVTLKGIGFSNSTLNITGALNLSSDKWLTLDGNTINASQGVVLNGTQGVTLRDYAGGNTTTLTATTPDLLVVYDGAQEEPSLADAVLNISGNTTMLSSGDLTLSNVALKGADSGRLMVSADGTFTVQQGTNLSAGDISISGNSLFLNGSAPADATEASGSVLNATTGNLNLTVNGSGNVNNGGGNITLQAAKDVNLTVNTSFSGKAITLDGMDITAGNDLVLNAATSGTAGNNFNVISMSGGNLTATAGNLSITASGAHSDGTNAVVSLGGGATLSAGKAMTLTGTNQWVGTGVRLNNVSLNAASLSLCGSTVAGGTGFSLTNITLSEALKDLTNVTFSSAGSSANTTNLLDNSVVSAVITGNTLDTFLSRGADNLTQIEMNGTAVFSNTSSGWTEDYSNASKPDGGWLLNNTSVTAGGDVNLTGVGFGNSTLSLTSGNLTLSNTGDLQLSDSNVTLANGSMNLSTTQGDLSLSGTTVTQAGEGSHTTLNSA
ncbi:hypothetical protein DQY68_26630, partial [Salmonella enterica subsp. salamae]|nr:hypothetical protein [Salmonella enterica subsp. salamae]